VNTALPPALRKALDLLIDPPADPDASLGYLDLLGAGPVQEGGVPTNTGAIQAAWASPIGSMLYDNTQAVFRRLATVAQQPTEWLDIPRGGTALDVGSGPGNVTVTGPRCGAGRAGSRRRHLRADAGTRGPCRGGTAGRIPSCGRAAASLRDSTVDAVVSIAVLQLVPDPETALAEMSRVLRPGGRLAVMVPTAGPSPGFGGCCRTPELAFGEDELGDILEANGFVSVRTKIFGTIQWVRAKRG
jgi:SAM-dependent methyltransferase